MNAVERVRHGLTHYEYVRDISAENDAVLALERLVDAATAGDRDCITTPRCGDCAGCRLDAAVRAVIEGRA